jgi:hypothetical protein
MKQKNLSYEMIIKSYEVKSVVGEKLFSAEGSNILFDKITADLQASTERGSIELIIDFESIPVVSTSFIGRFQQRAEKIKIDLPVEKLRLINLKKEIKAQFLRR